MNSKSDKLNKHDIICSVVFLVWFFISIIVLAASAKNGTTWLMMAVFGQYFLVFGTVACIKLGKEKKLLCNSMIWIVVAIGVLALVYAIDAIDGDIHATQFSLLSGVSIIGCGVIAFVGPLLDVWLRKRRCTHTLYGNIIAIETRISTRHTNAGVKRNLLYCPVYEIYNQGETMRLCSGHFDRRECVKGQNVKLMINPSNPEDFYDSSRMKGLRLVDSMFAVCYMAVGILLLYIRAV